jgi:hypothetical protein
MRNGEPFDATNLEHLDPYWGDLIRLLQVFRCSKNKDPDRIEELRESMSSPIYHPFIGKRLTDCQKRLRRRRLRA